jgi:hypothetical protein
MLGGTLQAHMEQSGGWPIEQVSRVACCVPQTMIVGLSLSVHGMKGAAIGECDRTNVARHPQAASLTPQC